MSEPLAYFLTWTTYGTWLHGDGRGSVDRSNAAAGLDYHAPNPAWQAASHRRMKAPGVVLSSRQRELVEQAVREHAAHKGWRILALTCRSNHVHLVVTADGTAAERVMTEMKAYATRTLRAEGEATAERLWTRHGSTRYLRAPASLHAAMRYVETQ